MEHEQSWAQAFPLEVPTGLYEDFWTFAAVKTETFGQRPRSEPWKRFQRSPSLQPTLLLLLRFHYYSSEDYPNGRDTTLPVK